MVGSISVVYLDKQRLLYYTDTYSMSAVTVTDSTFEQEVLHSDTPVLVDFWAEWCQPCRLIGPMIEELADEFQGKIKIAKMNVDENLQTPSMFGIMSIPTIILFKDGKPGKTIVGAQGKDVYRQAIQEVAA